MPRRHFQRKQRDGLNCYYANIFLSSRWLFSTLSLPQPLPSPSTLIFPLWLLLFINTLPGENQMTFMTAKPWGRERAWFRGPRLGRVRFGIYKIAQNITHCHAHSHTHTGRQSSHFALVCIFCRRLKICKANCKHNNSDKCKSKVERREEVKKK